jgi:hypothetical protein
MTPARSREDELCLLLAGGKLSSEERARTLQCLATPLQWPLILERAYSHQVYPLLYPCLHSDFPASRTRFKLN